jgi:uncharacterized membrane protein YfcA
MKRSMPAVWRWRAALAGTLLLGWCLLWFSLPDRLALLQGYWHFSLLGLLGATVANSTGAGGGVVFIPSFTSLGLSANQSLATSILIQCFGMTAGSISWLLASHAGVTGSMPRERLQHRLLLVCGPASIAGVLAGQYFVTGPADSMVTIFRGFSILFGATLLYMSLLRGAPIHTQYRLRQLDIVFLVATCLVGGAMTAWISVAIGEFVALLLIFRHYPTMVAICTGVCMSSLSVLAAAFLHVSVRPAVAWEVVLFAAPAAIIGGSLARLLAVRMGPARLKIFFATWILVTGLVM